MPLNDWKWDILTQSDSRYEDKIFFCLKVSMPFLLLCLQLERSQKCNNEIGFSDWSFLSTEFGFLLCHIFMVSFLVAPVRSTSEFSVATVSEVMAEIWKWECYSTLALPAGIIRPGQRTQPLEVLQFILTQSQGLIGFSSLLSLSSVFYHQVAVLYIKERKAFVCGGK